jgi:hypothetical protein
MLIFKEVNMNYPQIVNSSLALQANLNNITWNSYKRRINGKFLFNFKCYEEALKTEYILTTNMIKINNSCNHSINRKIGIVSIYNSIKGIFKERS